MNRALKIKEQHYGKDHVETAAETKHSSAVTSRIIAALMESQGTNPQSLYAENGYQFQRPYANPDFIMRPGLWDKMTSHFAQSDQRILTLTAHGLGGMGKTELAQYYYQHPPRPYTLRAWFYGESKEQIYLQYIELANVHGIKFTDNMPIEEKGKKIKTWLGEQKDCLLIYDNVSGIKIVEEVLPEQGKHHILITSRNAIDWPVHQMLDVDVMEEAEAIALIGKITGYKEDDSNIKQLAKTLGYLPLALAQAGAYIAVKSLSIKDYLDLYQDYQPKLLIDKSARNPKHEPIWITFDINFEALEKDCPKALETLKQASWLGSSAIPEILLLLMVNSTEDKRLIWNDIKKYIKGYSLMRINIEEKQLSIHPLLQDIIRLKQDAGQQLQYFKQCSEILNALESSLYQTNLAIYKTLVPHAEHLHERVQKIALGTSDIKTRELLLLEPISLGMFYLRLYLSQLALKFLVKTLSIYEIHYDKDHLKTAAALGNLGNVYLQLGKFPEARAYYERALTIQERHYGQDHVETAVLLGNLGTVYRQLGELPQARAYSERALKIKEQYYGQDHVEATTELGNLGTVYLQLGKLQEARVYYERALTIQEQHYGQDHVQTAASLGSLGTVYSQLGKLPEARAYYERALKIQEQHYGQDHVETAASLGNLGTVYRQLGKLPEARAYYERALKIAEQHYGQAHVETAAVLGNLGNVYRRLGKLPEARAYYKRALKIKEQHYGQDHVETVASLGNLGNVYRQLGKLPQARAYYERALKIKKQNYGQDHVETASTLANLGILYQKLNQFEDAIQYLERAKAIYKKNFTGNYPDLLKVEQALKEIELALSNVGNQSSKTSSSAEQLNTEVILRLKTLSLKLNKQGVYYFQAKEYTNALRYFEKALKLQQQISSIPNEEIATLHFNIGSIYFFQNDYQSAIAMLQTAYDLRSSLLGDLHETTKKAKTRLEECREAIMNVTLDEIMLETEYLDSTRTRTSPLVFSVDATVMQNETQEQPKVKENLSWHYHP